MITIHHLHFTRLLSNIIRQLDVCPWDIVVDDMYQNTLEWNQQRILPGVFLLEVKP